MKFLSICFINFLLFNPVFAEETLNKSNILAKTNECLNDTKGQACRKLILQLEKFQFYAFESNRFKCQTSILGLQTELVMVHFFENTKKLSNRLMIPHVIKNC